MGIGPLSCEVFLRFALLQSGLGAQNLQGSGQTKFPGIPGHLSQTFPTYQALCSAPGALSPIIQ